MTVKDDLLPEVSLDMVTELPLLDSNQLSILNNSKQSISKAYHNTPHFRTSKAVINFSVLNDIKHSTPESKLFQCYRELKVQSLELIGLNFRYKEHEQDTKIQEAKIEELEEKIKRCEVDGSPKYKIKKLEASLEKARIKFQRLTFDLNNIENEAKHRVREISMWDEKIKELTPIVEERGFSTESPEDSELLSYAIRYIRQKRTHLTNNIENSGAEAVNHDGQLVTMLRLIREQKLEDTLFLNMESEDRYFTLYHNFISLNKVPIEYQSEFLDMFIAFTYNQFNDQIITLKQFSEKVSKMLKYLNDKSNLTQLLKLVKNETLNFLIENKLIVLDGENVKTDSANGFK